MAEGADAVTYDNAIRTRFGAVLSLVLLGAPAAAIAVARFRSATTWENGVHVLWVSSVTAVTIRLLLVLGRLERERPAPDAGMNALLEAAALIPVIGFVPVIWIAAQR